MPVRRLNRLADGPGRGPFRESARHGRRLVATGRRARPRGRRPFKKGTTLEAFPLGFDGAQHRHPGRLRRRRLLRRAGGTGPTPLALTGVAATGAAISGQTVEAKCSTGTGTATSNADGSYTISVTAGVLPCVLKITPATGPALYSVASGTGSSATANISPVTHLVVASLTGGDPAAYFTGFDATAAAGVTDANVTAAVTAVKTTLLAAGVDLGTIDVLAGTLTPATGTTAGNAYDQALDALAAKLATAGTTLTTLTTTVAAASPAAPPTAPAATTGVASLPADLLLKPAASHCPALRSGSYRMVLPTKGSTLAEQTGTITVDAQTLSRDLYRGQPRHLDRRQKTPATSPTTAARPTCS